MYLEEMGGKGVSKILLVRDPRRVLVGLTFRHRASSIQDRSFATLQRTLFIYLINKYISLSDICLTVHIDINNIDNQLDATITAY